MVVRLQVPLVQRRARIGGSTTPRPLSLSSRDEHDNEANLDPRFLPLCRVTDVKLPYEGIAAIGVGEGTADLLFENDQGSTRVSVMNERGVDVAFLDTWP